MRLATCCCHANTRPTPRCADADVDAADVPPATTAPPPPKIIIIIGDLTNEMTRPALGERATSDDKLPPSRAPVLAATATADAALDAATDADDADEPTTTFDSACAVATWQ